MVIVLLHDVVVDRLLEFGVSSSDVGVCFAVVNKNQGHTSLVVGGGHAVDVMKSIQNQRGQLGPV